MLRATLAAGHLLQPLAGPLLRRRLARGKEDPDRWREKLGQASAARPEGPLVWLHGVGVGEVMALTGLIDALTEARPGLQVLVTSSARTSAHVFARTARARVIHQFLPLDLPGPVRRFLDHWRPDLAVWSDQDLWPRLIVQAARRGVPQAWVNARMNARAVRARTRFGAAFAELYGRLAVIQAQDAASAGHIRTLAPTAEVSVTGSLKSAAPPLGCDPQARAALAPALAGRKVWLAASSHPQDEAVALAAQDILHRADPAWLLIVAPRDVGRGADIAKAPRRSAGALPGPGDASYIADTMGEMGLWYGLARAALIGGSFGPVEGHNPWEAVALDCPVLHGPRTANFAPDYAALQAGDASRTITDAADLARALQDDLAPMAARAAQVRARGHAGLAAAREACLTLLDGREP